MKLKNSELRRHPVRQLLEHAATGQRPSEAELDSLKLGPKARRAVSDAAQSAASLRTEGENQRARQEARSRGSSIVGGLPEDHQDPDYLRPPEPETSDPAEMAAQLRRW